MAKNFTFIRDDVFPSWWANAIQEFIGTLVAGLEVRKLNDTTVEVPAGTFDDQVAVGIDGLWRYRTSTVTRAHPAGVAGTYEIYAVAANTSIVSTPLPFTDATNYAWDLRIEAPGATPTIVPGTVDVFRKIGQTEWDGTKITAVRQLAGQVSTRPTQPTSRKVDEVASRVRGMTGQTADIFRVEDKDSTAALLFSVSPVGKAYVLGELEIDGAINHDGTTVGFFNVTPVARPAATDDIKDALTNLGLLQGTSASPLNLDGGAATVGALTATGNVLLGDAITDTLGFFGAAGVAKQGATADIKDALASYGLLTNGGASPLDLDGGALTVGALTATGNVRLGDADADTLGFFSVAGAARQAATADIKDALAAYGLLTNGGASPLNLDGGQLTAGLGLFTSGQATLDPQSGTGGSALTLTSRVTGTPFSGSLTILQAGNMSLTPTPGQSLNLAGSGDVLSFYGSAGAVRNATAFTNGAGVGTAQYDLPAGFTLNQLAALVMTILKHLGDVNGTGLLNTTGV